MSLRHTEKFFVLFLSCFLSIKFTSTQEDSTYFFYQQPKYPRDCKDVRDQCSVDTINHGVYTIKPDGYPQPFEVYCNNDFASGGWTVIQRRNDGSVSFQRDWNDYKNGFGFLSSEFWIGNDKLSYLTNQAVYELRIDVVLSNGSSFYQLYRSFRISDEFSDYTLVSVGEFASNSSCVVSTCPSSTIHGGCSCQQSCGDPVKNTDCNDDCFEICVPAGCYVSETDTYISNGESYVNTGCTENCTCIDNQLSCDTDYECSTDASCTVKNGIRKCYCNQGYEGDGETCNGLYTDCYDAYQAGSRQDGVYTIKPTGWSGSPFNVSCDMTTDGGGWTVFQRRTDGMTDFYRYWDDFKYGFGSVQQGKDFWLGNEQIYTLTNQANQKLRVDIRTSGGSSYYAEYTSFSIGDESSKYQLSIGTYSGDAGNSLNSCNNGGQFSTRDQDNDGCNVQDFAERHKGAWWYNTAACGFACTECRHSIPLCTRFETRSGCYDNGSGSNLNGDHNGGNGENIFWFSTLFCNLNFAEMKIRRSSV